MSQNNKNFKVNFHINEICNYDCCFCFARTHSNEKRCSSTYEEKIKIIKALCLSNIVSGINFAGGEPLLDNHLEEYLKLTVESGKEASVITNGSLLFSNNLIHSILPYLSLLGISYHSFNNEINNKIGFHDCNGNNLAFEEIKELCSIIRRENPNCKIKINTVVNQFNKNEKLINKLEELKIDKWKILKCQSYDNNKSYLVTDDEFRNFVNKNRSKNIHIVVEEDMNDSYIMLNPKGCLKQKQLDNYSYSKSVLELPFDTLFKSYNFNQNRYMINHKE